MPNLFPAKEELRSAQEAVNIFSQNQGWLPNNKYWSDFLIHLELCFIKAERGCQDIKNLFQPFQGYYKKLRREDPLLSYLKNARDAVSHSMCDIVNIEIVSKEVINVMKLSRLDGYNGKVVEERDIPMYPSKMKLKIFENGGKTYNPPTIHLNKPLLCERDPFEVAYLGIKFYDDFLKEIERKFIPKVS